MQTKTVFFTIQIFKNMLLSSGEKGNFVVLCWIKDGFATNNHFIHTLASSAKGMIIESLTNGIEADIL